MEVFFLIQVRPLWTFTPFHAMAIHTFTPFMTQMQVTIPDMDSLGIAQTKSGRCHSRKDPAYLFKGLSVEKTGGYLLHASIGRSF